MEEGTVEKIWENETRGGKPYWVLEVAGHRYSIFDRDAVEKLREGDRIRFDWKKSGSYRNLIELQPAEHEQRAASYDRETSIVRMSCLRSAAELLAYQRMAAERKVDLALDWAKRFEEYVLGP